MLDPAKPVVHTGVGGRAKTTSSTTAKSTQVMIAMLMLLIQRPDGKQRMMGSPAYVGMLCSAVLSLPSSS
jgi:hypothetical protein